MNWAHIITGCLLLVKVVTFMIYGIDKYKAIKGKWRIPEATLLLIAFFDGTPKGGTFYTCRKAKTMGMDIINLYKT